MMLSSANDETTIGEMLKKNLIFTSFHLQKEISKYERKS